MEYFLIENIIFFIVYLVSFICFKHNKQVSLALFTTNTLGWILPLLSLNAFSAFSFLIGSAICLIGSKEVKGNEINHAVAYIYCLRVISDIPKIAGCTGIEISWIISMILLTFQLVLAGGAGMGYGKRFNDYISRYWGIITNTNPR